MTSQRSTGEWSLAVRQQASIARIGQLGLEGVELSAVLDEALLALAETLDVDDVGLFELEPDWSHLTGRAGVHHGRPVQPSRLAGLRFPAGRESLPGYTVLQGVVVVAPELLNDPRFTASAPRFEIASKAAIAAPVTVGGHPWGVVGAYVDAVRCWTEDDIHFVGAMANTIGLTISRQHIERDLRDSSARLDLSLAAGGLGSFTWAIGTDRVTLSASAMAIHGFDPESFDGTGTTLLSAVHPDDRFILANGATTAASSAGYQHHTYRIVRPNGEIRWVESWGQLLQDGQAIRMIGVLADITDRHERESLKERLLAAEQQARLEAELAKEHLILLAEASARFGETLDTQVILASLVEFCVPRLTDICVVDLFDDQGLLVEAAASTRDEKVLADIRLLRERRDVRGEVSGRWSERLVAGRALSLFQPRLTEEHYQAAAAGDEYQLELFRRINLRSVMVTPLVARGRVLGVISLVALDDAREPGPNLLALVEDLASRASLAIDNGRLFESRNLVARSLQAALLPPVLPQIAGLGLAAKYRVAEGDIEIGGDFYDVIEVGQAVWGIVVGDVCGRGPDAAAITGLMRHSIRAAVVRELLPSRVLALTNDAVLDQIDDSRFCTAAYLRVELDRPKVGSVRVVASSAGHPRPVVLRSDGRAEVMDCSGLLLGVAAQPHLVDVEFVLDPGDAVVLYTDGVTEARRGKEMFGEGRLLETVRSLAGRDAEGIAAGLDDAVSLYQDDANDDVAILVAKVMPS